MTTAGVRAEPAAAPVRVFLTRALIGLFPDAPSELTVQADTVDGLLDALDARFPGMRDRLSDSRPAIRRNINVFVDGARAELDTALAPGAEVYVFTAMSGG